MEAWRSLPRLVRDLAAGAGIAVRLQTEGSDTLLDRQVLDVIRDPIAHLVRNCLSHGLEPAAERIAAGKPAEGLIQLSAAAAEGQVVITISDDGRGIDLDAIRAKALAAGIVSPAQLSAMTDAQVAGLVFARHFSTAAQVNDLAGRGVGLDAAAAGLAAIGGSLTVDTPVPGRGAVFVMRVPLTLAMLPAVVVRAGAQRFVLPRLSIVRFCRLPEQYDHAGGMPVLHWQDTHVPLLFLPEALTRQGAGDHADAVASCGFAVIIRAGGMTAALAIEEIIWTGDVIVKPLPDLFQSCGVYLGLTLLSDRAPAMILDARRMMQRCGVEVKPQQTATPLPAAQTERLLIFEQDGLCAVPVAAVDAARRAAQTDFHTAHDGVLYYACGEDMLPVMPITDALPVQGGMEYILILRKGGQRFCLTCRRISGVVDVPQKHAQAGSRIIEGCAVDVIDIAKIFPHAEPYENIQPDEKAKRNLLLIDDSPFFCSLLTPVLQQAGYNVDVAQDVESALRLRDAGRRFDIIISDIEMPGMDGLSFARAVRAAGSLWRKTPLLALSAHATRHDEKRGRAAGFDDFITKFDRGRLLGALSTWGRRA